MSQKYKLKNEYQKFIRSHKYALCIVVQPTPSQYFRLNEITQILRIINFKLNKYFLKSKWPTWDCSDKFWWVGFQEGSEGSRNIHYHFLLHSPSFVYRNNNDFTYYGIETLIQKEWHKCGSINNCTFEVRKDLDSILHITENINNGKVVTYASKGFNPQHNGDRLLII